MTTILTDEAKWRLHVLYAIADARSMNDGLRFGQLLFNALALHDKTNYTGEDYNADFHQRLFYIEDEELLNAFEGWFKFCEEQNKPVEPEKEETDTSS